MSDIKIQPSGSGTAVVTLTAPATNTARTITFPDSTSTLLASDGSAANLTAIPAANITGTLPALSAANLTAIPAANITGTLPAISGANLTGFTSSQMPAGSVLQVKSTNYQGAYSTTSASWVDVANFNVTITPSATSSKILVEAILQMSANDWFGINVVREVSGQSDVIINQGNDTVGNKQNSTYGAYNVYGWDTQLMAPLGMIHLDSPATTSEITYQIQVVGRYGTTSGTVYINRPHSWNNDSISGRVTSSNIVVTEVAQ